MASGLSVGYSLVMLSANELIDGAIEELASQPVVFSALDVVACTGGERNEHDIENALRVQCEKQAILSLNEPQDESMPSHRYLGIRPAEHWWYYNTMRLAERKIYCLTSSQLANAMALAFDTRQWNVVPHSLLAAGRRWAMVSDGYSPHTFVFPWAVVLHTNPACTEAYRSIFVAPPFSVRDALSLEAVLDKVLSRLTDREANIVRGRFGFDTGSVTTLEQLGSRYGVTRERIRQIARKAVRKLKGSSCRNLLWRAFAADFLQSGGSLLIPESMLTAQHTLLVECIGLKMIHISRLKLHVLWPKDGCVDYLNALRDLTGADSRNEQARVSRIKALTFLSQRDGDQLHEVEENYFTGQVRKSRSLMLYDALRLLGRAAHYTEIADKCNRLFPENQNSVHNWHAALSRCAEPEREELGIVWIGRHGMYGLKEQGYSRPDTDLFEATAQVVREKFAETQQPVSIDVVMTELGKQRRELKRNSVVMALGFNDSLETVEGGEYIPKTAPSIPSPGTQRKPGNLLQNLLRILRGIFGDRR